MMQFPKALFFDQDGTIIDTERDGHRIAFNRAFAEFGFDVDWDVEQYYRLLKITGGKERMRHHLHTKGFGKPVAKADEDELIINLHKRKTEIFIELLQTGSLPVRPGIHRLMREANQKGIPICICTTAAPASANAVANHLLADIKFEHILAGEIIANKKPAPDIYLLALEKTGLQAEECVAIEDSNTGLRSGLAAGLPVIITTSIYTSSEDFSGAALVVNRMGEAEGPKAEVLAGEVGPGFNGVVELSHLSYAIDAMR